jgi:glycosyltransferase involved in cell wall biosynthesis
MNKELPLISIALATYNGEKFLRKQLDSIFSQTYKNIEVIVCDDCSSDSTVSILEEYRSKFGLEYCINEKNLGFVKNFEKAISLCTGEYIALSDQDDVWMENKIEELLNYIGDNDLVFADAEIIDSTGKIIFNSFKDYISVKHPKKNQLARLLYGNYIYGASMFFKASLKKKILPFPEDLPYHDIWIAIAAAENNSIKFDNRVLNQYRLHGNNNTGVSNLSDFEGKLKFFNQSNEIRNRKRQVYVDIIKLSKMKYTKNEQSREFLKAEKYHNLMLNENKSFLFGLYRLFYLMYFSIKNKYIFDQDLNYLKFFIKLFHHFLLSNSVTRKVILLTIGKKRDEV